MDRRLTLGSLFDGSGGFPLGALLNGIDPVWASEIEPFPIRVTTRRMPWMRHCGDITRLDGAILEPVDIITFGSPCTDMSVAGKRAGLDGSQSVLFHEAIRIIREMRFKTDGKYPRYAVWENVPGAFSSNGGADFSAVLNAFIGIAAPGAKVPPPEGGRWPYADVYMGDGWSVAYRTVDAQYFGVPQRRRRIYLVADLAGGSAAEILFERQGMPGDPAPGGSPRQGIAGNAQDRAGAPGSCVIDSVGGQSESVSVTDVMGTLKATHYKCPPCVTGSAGFCAEHSAKSRSVGFEDERSPTLRAGVVPGTVLSFEPGAAARTGGHACENVSCTLRAKMGDNQAAVAIESHPADGRCRLAEDGNAQTLTSRMGTGGMNVPLVMNPAHTLKIRSGCEGGGKGALIQDEMSATLGCNNDQTVFAPAPICFGICSDKSHAMLSANPRSGVYEARTSRTIDANGGNPGCNQGGVAVVEGFPFTQDQRDEARIPGGKSGALCVSATKRQTFVLQGSVIGRKDGNGPQGGGVNEEVSFTLDATDRHAVAYAMTTGGFQQTIEERSPTLMSRDYKDAPIISQPASFYPQMKAGSQCFRQDGTANTLINGTCPGSHNGLVGPDYIVRRLTPTECARLQGFPDGWCSGLGTADPDEEEIRFWADVWETHRRITGKSGKPKSRKQIVKWLNDPYSDAAEYKMWGNGVALPCVCFVLSGIAASSLEFAEGDPSSQQTISLHKP